MDVARLAGVSKKSVSRVLNDEQGVSERTREHIRSVIAETGYQPDRRARALAGQGSYLLALAYNNRNPAYVIDLLQGALARANELGFEIILHPVEAALDQAPADIMQLIRRSGIDGLILTPPLSEDFHLYEGFRSLDVPIVRVAGDDVASPVPQISFDDRAAAFAVTNHLIANGHKKIGFVGGPKGGGPTRRRLAGFLDAMRAQSLATADDQVVYGDFTFLSGMNAGSALLETLPRPSAIMCCNDEMAAGVMHSARESGVRVPDNISVTGFDDGPIARQVWPSLTTVKQPLHDMGKAAIDQLIGLVRKEKPEEPIAHFSHELVERNSVAQASH